MSLRAIVFEGVGEPADRVYHVRTNSAGAPRPPEDPYAAALICDALRTWIVATHLYLYRRGVRQRPDRADDAKARQTRAAIRERAAITHNGAGWIGLANDLPRSRPGASRFVESTLRTVASHHGLPVFIGFDIRADPPFQLAQYRARMGARGHPRGFTYPLSNAGRLVGAAVIIAARTMENAGRSNRYFAVEQAEAVAHELTVHAQGIVRGLPWRHGSSGVDEGAALQQRIRETVQWAFEIDDSGGVLGNAPQKVIERMMDRVAGVG